MIHFTENEFAPFYANYITKSLQHTNVVDGLKQLREENIAFFKAIPKDKLEYQYEVGKWTPKDILLHLIIEQLRVCWRNIKQLEMQL